MITLPTVFCVMLLGFLVSILLLMQIRRMLQREEDQLAKLSDLVESPYARTPSPSFLKAHNVALPDGWEIVAAGSTRPQDRLLILPRGNGLGWVTVSASLVGKPVTSFHCVIRKQNR